MFVLFTVLSATLTHAPLQSIPGNTTVCDLEMAVRVTVAGDSQGVREVVLSGDSQIGNQFEPILVDVTKGNYDRADGWIVAKVVKIPTVPDDRVILITCNLQSNAQQETRNGRVSEYTTRPFNFLVHLFKDNQEWKIQQSGVDGVGSVRFTTLYDWSGQRPPAENPYMQGILTYGLT